jgi:hypothetical protein
MKSVKKTIIIKIYNDKQYIKKCKILTLVLRDISLFFFDKSNQDD